LILEGGGIEYETKLEVGDAYVLVGYGCSVLKHQVISTGTAGRVGAIIRFISLESVVDLQSRVAPAGSHVTLRSR